MTGWNPDEVRERYAAELYDRIVPFWENHSIDRACGGYLHCLDREGNVYDTFKDMWMEWREVYMFAALANRGRRSPQWVELARHGYDFLFAKGRIVDGSYFTRLNRDGTERMLATDGSEVFREVSGGYMYDWPEETYSADIPSGSHKVQFSLGARSDSGYYFYYDTSSYWLDDFQVHYVQKPTFKPATTDDAATAAAFTGEQMVTLQSPTANCKIYYTLDGSDPNEDGAILYEGPFFIDANTQVKAIAVQPGKGTSAIASGQYVSHRAVRAGEWTLWGEGAYEAAKSGRAVAELCWDLNWCSWSKALEPIITGDAFTTWAAANDIYLLALSWGDLEGTGSRFWNYGYYPDTALREEFSGVAYPTFLLVSGNGTCLGAMLARNDNEHNVNGIYYRDTPESLIASFASILGLPAPLAAPVASVTDASGKTYPFSVTLSNPNGSGTIYYHDAQGGGVAGRRERRLGSASCHHVPIPQRFYRNRRRHVAERRFAAVDSDKDLVRH